jgi:putative colanic acid biosynthesis acetyltransferase WcaF
MKNTVDNSVYRTTLEIGRSKLVQILWYYTNIILFNSYWFPVISVKRSILRLYGAKVGMGVVIKPGVNIKYPWKLEVGDHAWIGEEVWIDNLSSVHLGSSVTLSQGALLLTGSHDHSRSTFDFMSRPIIVEDGAWVAARSTVLGGVRVGTHAVLSVNSVANKDLEAYKIYKGNPCQVVREREIH